MYLREGDQLRDTNSIKVLSEVTMVYSYDVANSHARCSDLEEHIRSHFTKRIHFLTHAAPIKTSSTCNPIFLTRLATVRRIRTKSASIGNRILLTTRAIPAAFILNVCALSRVKLDSMKIDS